MFDPHGFLKEEEWEVADDIARGRLWSEAASWCVEWQTSMASESAQTRLDRWQSALGVDRVRSELQGLIKFKV